MQKMCVIFEEARISEKSLGSSFLMEEHKDMHIDVILFDEKTKATYTIASDGDDQCFSFDPYTKYEPNGYQIIPEWDFNFDYYLYNLLDLFPLLGKFYLT